MKPLDIFTFALSLAGALAGYLLLDSPLSWVIVAAGAFFAAWSLFADTHGGGQIVLRLGGLSWSMEDFVRGWLITGRTGSGKTQSAINAITFQIFQNVKNWGGICLDQKGLYWEILVKMAAHFGRGGDLILLQTRPPGEDALWRPPHTINITGNPSVRDWTTRFRVGSLLWRARLSMGTMSPTVRSVLPRKQAERKKHAGRQIRSTNERRRTAS